MHRWWRLLATAVVTLGGIASVAGAEEAPAADPVLVVDGRGWGHGVGMAQDGALAMGRTGASTAEILGMFYPGTAIGHGSGTLRVNVFEPSSGSVVVELPQGGDVRSPASGAQHGGFPIAVDPGGRVRVWRDGNVFAAEPLTGARRPDGATASIAPEPVWAVPAAGGVASLPEQGRRYRGVAEITAGPFRVVNQVDVEDYLRGMGEVRDPSWPLASLETQAVAARTYALWYASAKGELCNGQRCQVYLGQQAEYAAMDRAVANTAGQVLLHQGGLIQAVYSANAGGHLASPLEGFGNDKWSVPYLRPAPYPTDDPMPWTETFTLADAARRLGYRGTPTSVTVSNVGPSGRALEVLVTGDAGEHRVTGLEAMHDLGLRSNLFTVSGGGAVPGAAAAGAAPTEARVLAGVTEQGVATAAATEPGPIAAAPSRAAIVATLPGETAVGAAIPAGLGRAPWLALATLLVVGAAQATVVMRQRLAR